MDFRFILISSAFVSGLMGGRAGTDTGVMLPDRAVFTYFLGQGECSWAVLGVLGFVVLLLQH